VGVAVVRRAFIFSIGLWFIGCSAKIQVAPRNAEDAVTLPLDLALADGGLLTENKRNIARRVAEGQPVSYAGITETILEAHHENWVARHPKARNPSFKQVVNTFRLLAAPLTSSELPQMKAEIEKRAGDFVYPQALVYNARAVSVLDAPYDKRIQSYSGTMLFLLSLRQALGPEGVAKRNLVVIFENGHILIGYVVKAGDQWELHGIETTVSGTGHVNYGPIAKAKQERRLRIVDADLFIWVELYKFVATNLVALTNQALEKSAQMYDFAEPDQLDDNTYHREVNTACLDWTPFSFGSKDTRDQDLERTSFAEAVRNDLPQASPNMTIQRAKAVEQAEAATPTIEKAAMNPYPFRQVPAPSSPGDLVPQCWDYAKQTWVDIPHRKEGGKYFIKSNPCIYSKADYEPVPPPLYIEPSATPASYSVYDKYEDWGFE
jgi:hypothetical protein